MKNRVPAARGDSIIAPPGWACFNPGAMRRVLFITGTDTGVGKTVLACLLARHWRAAGRRVAALKPVCSGGRADARALQAALGGEPPLDEINPWHFPAPVAPRLAARQAGQRVRLRDVLAVARSARSRADWLIVEGAGGLLSPLGEDFDSRDAIVALRAVPLVVCPNRLGAVNQSRLALTALPAAARCRAHLILMAPPRPDASTASNARLLGDYFDRDRIWQLPRLTGKQNLSLAGRIVTALRRRLEQ